MDVSTPSAELIEDSLRQIRGVIAARVVIADQHVTEIHILSALGRPIKHVVRDVESVCAARFHLGIDHRCISVAQINMNIDTANECPRPKLHGVSLDMTDEGTTVRVQLAAGQTLYTGEEYGRSGIRTRLAACATLHALESYVDGSCTLELTDLSEFSLAGQQGYVAVVTILSRGKEEKVIGCALIEDEGFRAGVRAVLDAVNRRLVQAPVRKSMMNR